MRAAQLPYFSFRLFHNASAAGGVPAADCLQFIDGFGNCHTVDSFDWCMDGNVNRNHCDTETNGETRPGNRGFYAEIVDNHQGIQEPIQGKSGSAPRNQTNDPIGCGFSGNHARNLPIVHAHCTHISEARGKQACCQKKGSVLKRFLRIAQPQPKGLRSPGLGVAPQQAEKPFVPRKRNGWFFAFVYTDALLATSKMLYYCNVCSKKCVKEEIKI